MSISKENLDEKTILGFSRRFSVKSLNQSVTTLALKRVFFLVDGSYLTELWMFFWEHVLKVSCQNRKDLVLFVYERFRLFKLMKT